MTTKTSIHDAADPTRPGSGTPTVESVMHRGAAVVPAGDADRRGGSDHGRPSCRTPWWSMASVATEQEWSASSGVSCPISISSARIDATDALTATAGDMAATPAVVTSTRRLARPGACLMHDYDIHHLLVVDSTSRRPVGIVSTLDLAAVVASAAS